MAESVLEKIAENVLTTLSNITGPDEYGGGYEYALDVERLRASTSASHLKAVIIQTPPDDSEDSPIGKDQWRQSFAVVVYVMPPEDDPTPIDTYNNSVYASIYKELMLDYSRGGLAINTIIKPVLHMPPIDGEPGGITFQFDVLYRHNLDNPY